VEVKIKTVSVFSVIVWVLVQQTNVEQTTVSRDVKKGSHYSSRKGCY